MTTFKEIRGKLIRTLDTDPTPATNYEGQIWYNKTIGVLKGASPAPASWSSGGNMNSGRVIFGMAGGQTASIAFGGGNAGTLPSGGNFSEEYNGSSWATQPSYPKSAYSLGSAGTQTATLGWNGLNTPSNTTEEYDGSTWTAGGNFPASGNNSGGGAGTQTAAFSRGTSPGDTGTYLYDGSTWTSASANLANPSIIDSQSVTGTQTAGLLAGGRTAPGPTNTNNSSLWDGTSWTAAPNILVAVSLSAFNGTQTLAHLDGGSYLTPASPESNYVGIQDWDGSSWASGVNMATARQRHGGGLTDGASSANGGIVAGGGTPSASYDNKTEEYNPPFVETKTLTTS